MDREAFEKVYNAHYMHVFSYVMTLTGDRHLAEEITQDAFFKAFSSPSGFRGEADEATWLCAIAKNRWMDENRRRGRSAPMPEDLPEEGRSLEQQITDRDSSFRVHVLLHGMEEPFREVFELRIFGELSFREIGTIFGKTENWARVTYHRARLKLRERMEKTAQG